ncbi:MAG: Gfo/Idh/MocA family oxidoreductase [Clostridia bacterium]|nr:Gfo/Idh/MocA family oxidoreductase [Clostridia bacterium]
MNEIIKVLVVGCGDRATVYCEEAVYALKRMQVVAAVDPDDERLRYMKERFHVPETALFHNIAEVLRQGKIADCVINGTMDQMHIQTALPFLEQGYDMLLEKPITNNRADLLKIRDVAKQNGCKLMICHVLRFTSYYRKVKSLIDSGVLGRVMNIQTSERVGAFHSSVSYIRGKWNSEKNCGSSLLLAKCCHDIDLVCWFNNRTVPKTVQSNGGRDFFTPANAPKGSGTRCLVDCPEEIRKSCIYDVQSMYLDNCLLPWYPWQCTGKNWQDVTDEEKVISLKTDNPNGRCIYKCEEFDIVDHQNVIIRFADGSTAVHTVILGSMKPGRSIWIQGTAGELEGSVSDGTLTVRKYDKKTSLFTEETVNFDETEGETGGHFGGDKGLVADFCDLLEGKQPSISCTAIEDSINGHLTCYCADKALKFNRPVDLDEV